MGRRQLTRWLVKLIFDTQWGKAVAEKRCAFPDRAAAHVKGDLEDETRQIGQ